MPPTNFELAPPVKTVDGLVAVPMDIQKINATLTFDGAASSGSADATIEFITGVQNGNPIFDLRQTITEAWLDGASLPVAKLAHHDFGGGINAQLRIIEKVLPKGTTHTLRVKYSLGLPQASTAGGYQPAITWSAGPRLAFNFGFTDLGPGRYLESWIPANLIFDQFELSLTLRIINTAIPHTVITNGTVSSLGTNHWSVTYPARFTALSTLLELRATNTLAKQSGTVMLPVSGVNVTIDVWKLTSGSANLATELANIKTFLTDNENAVGPYIHGSRFVAFLHQGGMEYEGGTTTGTGALKHETFHSWWARGLKPASQPDAWWDEAWTVYNTEGGGSTPFDFTDPAVTLCTRNPWSRLTPDTSYSAGKRFFQGVAALIGAANLKALMSDFYKQRREKLTTTTDIEEFLVCRTGNAQLVDAFHRFVYGFNNPSPVPDLWLRDDPAHTGADAWAGTFWNSPDLWIRNANDNGTTHQPPEFGQDNWFYARVRNRSATATARHFLVTFNVKAFAGVEFQYPNDFLPCVAAASGFELGPGQSAIVKAKWPKALVPPAGTHACWLASVLTRLDHPVSGRHVWQHNNLAQKNLTIVDLKPGQWILLPFVVSNLKTLTTRRVLLEVVRPKGQLQLPVTLAHQSGAAFSLVPELKPTPLLGLIPSTIIKDADNGDKATLDCGGHAEEQASTSDAVLTSQTPDALTARQFADGSEVAFAAGLTAQIPLALRPSEQLVMGLRLSVPQTAKPGEVINLDLVQKDDKGKAIAGGLAIEIRVR